MNRSFILGLIAALGIGAQSCQQPQKAAEERVAATRPNILLIGAFGGEIATPTLNALAEQGLRPNREVPSDSERTREGIATSKVWQGDYGSSPKAAPWSK